MENKELTLEQHFVKLEKQLFWTRIISGIIVFLLICVLAGGIWVFRYVQQLEADAMGYMVQIEGYLQELEPAMEQLARLDMGSVNGTLEEINKALAQVDWKQLSDQISQLDVEALNEAIEGLDTEELTQALENLNETAEKLRQVGDTIASFTSKLNIFSKGN